MRFRKLRIAWWRVLIAVPCFAGLLFLVIDVFTGPKVFEDWRWNSLLVLSPFLAPAFLFSGTAALKARNWIDVVFGSVLPMTIASAFMGLLFFTFD